MSFLKGLFFYFLILTSLGNYLNAQEKSNASETSFFKLLSKSGKDVFFQSYFKKLGSYIVENEEFQVIKQKFTEYLEGHISKDDMQIIKKYWNEFEHEQIKSIIFRSISYKHALDCQLVLFDSIYQVYHPLLKSYFSQINQVLNKEQKELIEYHIHLSIEKLDIKQNQFLDYEKTSTLEIDSSIFKYLNFGFNIMKKIPSSKYYNLIGSNNSALNFIDTLKLDEYFNFYSDFETSIVSGLNKNGCRAHLAIPFYINDSDVAVEKKHTLRNSLFYYAIHNNLQNNFHYISIDIDSLSLDSILIEPSYTNSNIKDFIDFSYIDSLNLKEIESLFIFQKTFKNRNIQGASDLIISFFTLPSADDKKDFLVSFNTRESQIKYKKIHIKNKDFYYQIDYKESRHDFTKIANISGFTIINEELIMLNIIGQNITENQIFEYLSILK